MSATMPERTRQASAGPFDTTAGAHQAALALGGPPRPG